MMADHGCIQSPTLRERFWRRLGYRYHLGDEPHGVDALTGWMRTDIRLHFSLADRLRILFSGRLFIASIVYTDAPTPGICISRVDFRIESPAGLLGGDRAGS